MRRRWNAKLCRWGQHLSDEHSCKSDRRERLLTTNHGNIWLNQYRHTWNGTLVRLSGCDGGIILCGWISRLRGQYWGTWSCLGPMLKTFHRQPIYSGAWFPSQAIWIETPCGWAYLSAGDYFNCGPQGGFAWSGIINSQGLAYSTCSQNGANGSPASTLECYESWHW